MYQEVALPLHKDIDHYLAAFDKYPKAKPAA